jgi:hypothetical protein
MISKARLPIVSFALAGCGKSGFRAVALMFAFRTLHKSWPLTLIFSPYGRDKREGSRLRRSFFRSLLGVLVAMAVIGSAGAASNLTLAPGLSFDDDSSSNFPICGQGLADASVPAGEATVIFFGTSNCWNTAREAERLVKLYPQFRSRLHFVIIDPNSVAPGQKTLVARYYHGYIPTIAVIDGQGKAIYDRAGETAATRGDTINLQRLLDSVPSSR